MPETHTATCTSIGSSTAIATGTPTEGLDVVVSNKEGLTVRSVNIRDLGGFTGSYVEDLQGQAQVTMSGQTYTISGTAYGFEADSPSARTNSTFAIKVAC